MASSLGADRPTVVSTIAVRSPRSASAVISPAIALLGLVVGASALIRFVLALERSTHRYLPDEFLYGQLARSIADGDGLRVLGQTIHLPSTLQPLLTAPVWLAGDPELAFRLTQGLNAVAMSLAAVPAYLIAGELGLGRRSSLACGAAAVVSPDLLYVGYVTADAVGYTIALTAVLVGVRALARPTFAGQLSFLVLCGLAVSARLQYAALLPAVLAAALVVTRGRALDAARRYWMLGGAAAVAVAGGLLASDRLLGRYTALLAYDTSWTSGQWFARSAFLVALACGIVVVPSAIVWLGRELGRPKGASATAFAALLTALTLSSLSLSVLVGIQSEAPRFFERYLMLLLPLLFIAGATGLRRRASWQAPMAIAAALAATLALAPLSEFTAGQGPADSPFLLAVSMLEAAIGIGVAGLFVALAGTLLALAGLLAATGRIPRGLALGGTLVVLSGISVGAHAADMRYSERAWRSAFESDAGWVDATGLRSVLLLQLPGSNAGEAMITSLHNDAITAAATLGSVDSPIEGVGAPVTVRANGTLRHAGRSLSRPLLVTSRSARIVLASARPVARSPVGELYPAAHQHRLQAVIEGLAPSGTLARSGRLVIYPTSGDRCLVLDLATAPGANASTVRFRSEEGVRRIAPSAPATVAFSAREKREVDFTLSGRSRVRGTPSMGSCTQR
jgi:hypothetical protein